MAKQSKKTKAKVGSGTSKTKKAVAKKKLSTKKPLAKKAPVKKQAPLKKPSAKGKGKRKPETLMCFLTTACVHHYGLPDNGYELNTLRSYRDKQLAITKGGKELIRYYYQVSPQIVRHIEEDKDKTYVYEYIYSVVLAACKSIEKQNWNSARAIYTQMVQRLMQRYNIKINEQSNYSSF